MKKRILIRSSVVGSAVAISMLASTALADDPTPTPTPGDINTFAAPDPNLPGANTPLPGQEAPTAVATIETSTPSPSATSSPSATASPTATATPVTPTAAASPTPTTPVATATSPATPPARTSTPVGPKVGDSPIFDDTRGISSLVAALASVVAGVSAAASFGALGRRRE